MLSVLAIIAGFYFYFTINGKRIDKKLKEEQDGTR